MAPCSKIYHVSSYHTNITSIIWIPTSMVCKTEGTHILRAGVDVVDDVVDELIKKLYNTR